MDYIFFFFHKTGKPTSTTWEHFHTESNGNQKRISPNNSYMSGRFQTDLHTSTHLILQFYEVDLLLLLLLLLHHYSHFTDEEPESQRS